MKTLQQAYDDMIIANPNNAVIQSLEFMIVLHQAIEQQGFIEAYEKLAKVKLLIVSPPKNAIEVLIDQATGFNGIMVDGDAFPAFINFVRESVYDTLDSEAMKEIQAAANRMRGQDA